jgi:hypothetical protein
MAKKRSETWGRGTCPVDQRGHRRNCGCRSRGRAHRGGHLGPRGSPGGPFTPIPSPGAVPRRWPLSAEGTTALLAAIVLGGGIILYVAGIKTDVAVVSTRVDAMQKSHDADTTTLREEIRRVESALEARLNRLLELLPGRRDAKPQSR